MDNHKDRQRWRRRAVWAAGAALAAATFTPLFIPPGRIEPRFAGMPYTLWAGIVVAMLFVGLTAAAARLDSEDGSDREEGRR